MTALPSFVELMASLGLDSPEPPKNTPLPHHSRSSSYSSVSSITSRSSSTNSQSNLAPYQNGSPAIVISQQHESPTIAPRDWEMERRRSRARYSPYSPPIVSSPLFSEIKIIQLTTSLFTSHTPGGEACLPSLPTTIPNILRGSVLSQPPSDHHSLILTYILSKRPCPRLHVHCCHSVASAVVHLPSVSPQLTQGVQRNYLS